MEDIFPKQKRAGKTEFAGRRRSANRKSGFSSHPEATGGRLREKQTQLFRLEKNQTLDFIFKMPNQEETAFFALGVYYKTTGNVRVRFTEANSVTNSDIKPSESFQKFGRFWKNGRPTCLKLSFFAQEDCNLSIYEPKCGSVFHEYFDSCRPELLNNMNQFAPEANFYSELGGVTISDKTCSDGDKIWLKECNRCARFLPVNIPDERDTLSFSNHCVKRRPCKHKGFGRLENISRNVEVQLEYGFQLECRVCKKFAVNAPLNPQRTADQMKEDGQRRRHFELLLEHLHEGSAQLKYRHETGKELATSIWQKFGKKCFNCSRDLPSVREMHLDHTRPLAMLWRLDGTATALCKECNTQKRDRAPSEFYNEKQLVELSKITKIDIDELKSGKPNKEAIRLILEKKDWLFGTFLRQEHLLENKDGKRAADLICKALDRVISLVDKRKATLYDEFQVRF